MTAPSDLTEFNEETQTKPTESADFAVSETLSAKQGEDLSPDKKTTVPSAVTGKATKFALRMGEAGYITGRRYDAIKNAFLSYRPAEKRKKPLRARVTGGGETFSCGKKLLAKLCIVGGYLRLFLALSPGEYSEQKYHHKDYSDVRRYAKTPMMIKLSSDRQVKNAVSLIDDVMRLNGFVPDENYEPKDQAGIFKKPRKTAPKVVYVEREAAVPPIVHTETEDSAAAEPAVAAGVKAPARGIVFDGEGNRIGKVRRGVWYDAEDKALGDFREEDESVYFYGDGVKSAYLDGHDNVLSMRNTYVATLRRTPVLLLVLIILLVVMTALSVCLGAYFLTRSTGGDYAPTLFIADADGRSWDDMENIPVFMNEVFGDTVIAPGQDGTYAFTFENRNDNALVFSFTFTEANDYGIDITYRLKRDGAYIVGADGNYVGVEPLSVGAGGLTIEANSDSVFELEWKWAHNDAVDTAAGENGATYTLNIGFSAYVA